MKRGTGGALGQVREPTLFPTGSPAARPAELPLLDQRLRGTLYFEQSVGSIINPPETTGMDFWSVNPYVGCEFGCTYCYARYTHRYAVERAQRSGRLGESTFEPFAGEAWKAFEHRIFVKRKEGVLAALERDLKTFKRRTARDGQQTLMIGTATDPYQPAERRFGITRAVLERLTRERGFAVGIISKSPLVTRDVDVLRRLHQQHDLHINISLIGVDVRLVKLFEARSPMPHARLRGMKRLVDAGLEAGLIAAPVLPGITDSERRLDALLAATKAAGARFAHYAPLRLYDGVRPVFLPLIERHYPGLVERYRGAYGKTGHAKPEYRKALSERFRRLAARHGLAGRNDDDETGSDGYQPPASGPEQLELLRRGP